MFYNVTFSNNTYMKPKVQSSNKNTQLKLYNSRWVKLSGLYCPPVSFCSINKNRKYDNVNIDIPNLHSLDSQGLRGESLSIKKNQRFLPALKNLGIKHIIDLKTSDFSKNFQYKVEENSMTYLHFPMDAKNTSDRQIIEILPELFNIINNGDFYIACAQGLHRTDIALSVNYIFNKNETGNPPILYGHIENSSVRFSDIFRRTNSIFNSLTDEDRKKLGLEDFDEEKYKAKKKELMDFNMKLIAQPLKSSSQKN